MSALTPSKFRQLADEYDLGATDYGFDVRISEALRQASDDAKKLDEIEYGTGGYAQRLMDAIEGECHGLSIDEDQANAILGYVMTGLSPDDLTATRTPKEQTK